MAIKKQYALYDAPVSVFLNPVSFATDAEAIRWFTTMVNEQDPAKATMVSQHPEGFTLYRLMDYDDKLGKYLPRNLENSGEPSEEPKAIIKGIDVKQVETSLTLSDIKQLIQDIAMPQNVTKMNS